MRILALPTEIIPNVLTFYAFFILIGAICTLFIAMHTLKVDGHKSRALENVFYVAFPGGIIGARIWFVIANWSNQFAGQPFYHVFAIWEGGLAIEGGVTFGVIIGVYFVLRYRSYLPILYTMDAVIPAILIAQAIGRWGNFFNQEVYGRCVLKSEWSFLPSFILDQMQVCGSSDQIAVPLFLIESVANILGFLVIYFGIRKGLKKWVKNGDCAFAYFVYYGLLRFFMEPLRDPVDIMGYPKKYLGIYISQFSSIIWILVGIIGIVLCHFYYNKVTKKKEMYAEKKFEEYLEFKKENE